MLTLLCLVISTASLILRSLPGSVCIEFSHFGAYTFRKHWMSTERWLHPFSSSSSFLHPLSPLVCLSSSSSSLRSSLSHRLSSDPSLDVRVLDPASLSVLVQSSGSSPRVPAASSPGILPPLWLHRLRHDDPAVAVLALDTSESRSAEDIEAAVFQTVKGLSAGPRRAEGHRGLGAHVVVAVVAKEHEAAEVVSRGTPGKMADERVSVVVVGRRDGHAAGWGKLARVVREKAGWFYSEWIRVLSSWRDSVGAEDQQRRRMQADVRIALLMCFLQEGDAASKYFQQVYQEAEEELHREDEINCKEELKAVLYLCKFFQIKFLIRSGKFAEAVDAFSEHMGRAFKYVGKPETMAFRDLGWIALQYRIMAEFLDSHASPVMNSNRYHNPAYYFHLAAHYMRIRRSAFINSVDLNAGEINLSRAATYDSILESQRYFGNLISFSHSDTENQKPVQSLDSNGLQLEKEINQYLESGFQYTVQIIELLKMAYLHVKQLDSQRFMLFLCQEMAQEYFYSGEWKVALPLLDSILERYRLEKWEFLLVQTLRKTICCSLNLNMTDKAFAYTLEIMSLSKYIQEEEMHRYHDWVFKTIEAIPLEASTAIFHIPNKNLLQIRLSTPSLQVECGEDVPITIEIESFFLSNFTITALEIVSSDPSLDALISFDSLVQIKSGERVSFDKRFRFESPIEDFLISEVVLYTDSSYSKGFRFSLSTEEMLKITVVKMLADFSLEIIHGFPAIVGEYYGCTIKILTTSIPTQDVCLELTANSIVLNPSSVLFVKDCVSGSMEQINSPSFRFNRDVSLDNPLEIIVYLLADSLGILNLEAELINHSKSVVNARSTIEFVNPFKIDTNTLSYTHIPQQVKAIGESSIDVELKSGNSGESKAHKIFAGELFLLSVNISNESHHQLELKNFNFHTASHFEMTRESFSEIEGLEFILSHGESLTILCEFLCSKFQENCKVGKLHYKWSRSYGNLDPVSFEYDLPLVSIVEYPLQAHYGGHAALKIFINNHSDSLEVIDLTLPSACSNFAISGKKAGSLSISPHSFEILEFELVPLISGCLKLPFIKLYNRTYNIDLMTEDDFETILVLPPEIPRLDK